MLVLDDWGMSPLREAQRRDMLEILDDRSGARATVMTSQIPPNKWHTLRHPLLTMLRSDCSRAPDLRAHDAPIPALTSP